MADPTYTEASNPTAFPIARAGYPLIGGAAFATAVFALLELTLPALLAMAATFFIAWFFRDPDRVTPNVPGAVVSPADGKVLAAGQPADSPCGGGRCLRVSIFMSVFNVHVNRIPYGGTVKKIDYHPGKFINASFEKASAHNERNAVWVEIDPERTICFVQIAGLVARRILSRLSVGDRVIRGQRFGMICFGSRLDVYLPEDANIDVAVGDKVSAGVSILGYLP